MSIEKEPRGRLFQDSEFVFNEFDGLKIEQIIKCIDTDTKNVIIVYLKVENRNWHQFFLSAGIGFWENWDKIAEDIEDDEHLKYIDETKKHNLKGKQITKIYCVADIYNSKIILELENNEQLILRCLNPEIFDSDCELIKISPLLSMP